MSISSPLFIVVSVSLFFLGVFIIYILRLTKREQIALQREQHIISLYRDRINKIPALIETMKKHTPYADIFLELTHLHKVTIISNIASIYDILEHNGRMHREFLFLMKVATRIRDLHRNGNFLYIRDFLLFSEREINKEIPLLNEDLK